MSKSKKELFQKAILMAVLTGALMGAAHAGYDYDDDGVLLERDVQARGESPEVRAAHARMLIQTLSEEFTEVRNLASQQARFRQMGDAESTQIARMYGEWIREHKAGVPAIARLIRLHGGDPEEATEMGAPVLGTKEEMLSATHQEHQQAIRTSQTRYGATDDWGIQWVMHNRANVARKHISEMTRFH